MTNCGFWLSLELWSCKVLNLPGFEFLFITTHMFIIQSALTNYFC